MAVVQLRNPIPGRTFYDARKAGGTPSMMAMRALKRRLSNVVFTRMVADQAAREQIRQTPSTATTKARVTGPGGHSGHDSDSGVTGSHPNTGSSDQPLPGPGAGDPVGHVGHFRTERFKKRSDLVQPPEPLPTNA